MTIITIPCKRVSRRPIESLPAEVTYVYTVVFLVRFTGHLMDDGRLVDHVGQSGQMAIYGATAAGVLRSGSSNSSSPNAAGLGANPANLGGLNIGNAGLGMGHGHNPALLVVPQPINATKMGGPLGPGTGRKYQCKMCPQVSLDRSHNIRYGIPSRVRNSLSVNCSRL